MCRKLPEAPPHWTGAAGNGAGEVGRAVKEHSSRRGTGSRPGSGGGGIS